MPKSVSLLLLTIYKKNKKIDQIDRPIKLSSRVCQQLTAAMEQSRPSLAHLASKFNTAPPPGYVSGRGRGISGFTQPTGPPPKRGKPRRGAEAAAAAAAAATAASSGGGAADEEDRYGDADEGGEDTVGGADYEPDELASSVGGFGGEGGFDADGKLKGEAGDTRELDLGGTERFEVERTSMSQTEAGYAIEPFNMKQVPPGHVAEPAATSVASRSFPRPTFALPSAVGADGGPLRRRLQLRVEAAGRRD